MLSEETKWLAVTHKSFDHGRRGFNDRLAFLGKLHDTSIVAGLTIFSGKRVVELQASLGLLSTTDSSIYLKDNEDSYGRQPFQHPAINAVDVLSGGARTYFTHHRQMSNIATKYGISEIVRWLPKNVS